MNGLRVRNDYILFQDVAYRYANIRSSRLSQIVGTVWTKRPEIHLKLLRATLMKGCIS
jgi:hypothetical protein